MYTLPPFFQIHNLPLFYHFYLIVFSFINTISQNEHFLLVIASDSSQDFDPCFISHLLHCSSLQMDYLNHVPFFSFLQFHLNLSMPYLHDYLHFLNLFSINLFFYLFLYLEQMCILSIIFLLFLFLLFLLLLD